MVGEVNERAQRRWFYRRRLRSLTCEIWSLAVALGAVSYLCVRFESLVGSGSRWAVLKQLLDEFGTDH